MLPVISGTARWLWVVIYLFILAVVKVAKSAFLQTINSLRPPVAVIDDTLDTSEAGTNPADALESVSAIWAVADRFSAAGVGCRTLKEVACCNPRVAAVAIVFNVLTQVSFCILLQGVPGMEAKFLGKEDAYWPWRMQYCPVNAITASPGAAGTTSVSSSYARSYPSSWQMAFATWGTQVEPFAALGLGTQASMALPKMFNEPSQKNHRSAPGNCEKMGEKSYHLCYIVEMYNM